MTTESKEGASMVTEAEILEKVKDLVSKQLSISDKQITPEASFIEDLGADSLDTVELIMTLEEKFDIEISDEDAEKIKTVRDVVEYVKKRASEKGVSVTS